MTTSRIGAAPATAPSDPRAILASDGTGLPRGPRRLPSGSYACTEGHATNRPAGPQLACQDLRTGLYHLWDPDHGPQMYGCPRWSKCRDLEPNHLWPHLPDKHLGPPIAAALLPPDQRCNNHGWPLYIKRPKTGPLREQWPRGTTIPRWYVWWRLYELQEGRCACCALSPAVVDHDHRSGAVRGLLCISHNRLEPIYLNHERTCVHERPHCFEEYWGSPPARDLCWIQVGNTYHHSVDLQRGGPT